MSDSQSDVKSSYVKNTSVYQKGLKMTILLN